jgi:hypothetical protein
MPSRVRTKQSAAEIVIGKIRRLPPDKVVVVADFVDFLQQRTNDRDLARAGTRLAEKSFARVWDNPGDADYDKL